MIASPAMRRLRRAAAERVVRRGKDYRSHYTYSNAEARLSGSLYREAVRLYSRLVCLDSSHFKERGDT